MGNSKTSTKSSIKRRRNGLSKPGALAREPLELAERIHLPRKSCQDRFGFVEPQVNAEGTHVWPFDPSCPVDVIFLNVDGRHKVRMNRHGYFELRIARLRHS